MTAQKSLKIGVFGLDERAQKLLKLFFAGPCKSRFELVNLALSDIQLIDIDRPSGWGYYQKQTSLNPRQPLVAISLNTEKAAEVRFFIKKPMRLDTVLAVLEEAGGRLPGRSGETPRELSAPVAEPKRAGGPAPERRTASPARSAGATKSRRKGSTLAVESEDDQAFQFLRRSQDIDLSQGEIPADLFYEPHEYLQGFFQKAVHLARDQNSGVRVGGFWGHLYIVPERHCAYSELLDSRLRPLTVMRMPERDVEIQTLDSQQIEALAAKSGVMKSFSSIDSLIWKLALWSSRGRLPAGTDLNGSIFLRRWPNFTRCLETPNAMRIASLWARHPASLQDTQEALGVRQVEVAALFSAASAIGYAGVGRRQADSLISPVPVQPAPERGLFTRTLNRLFGHADEN